MVAVGKTQCSSHQECALPSTECGFVDAYLQPSFGNVLCGACTSRPMCLVASAGAVGHCVCTLRPTSYQACSQVGMRIMPDPTQLCLVSLASSAFSASSSTYSAGWPSLAAAQCALLNQAQTYCLNVFDGSVDLSLVVGLSMLSASGSRRRLLLLPQPALATDAPPLFLNHTAEWLGATEPCRSLMLALLRLDEAGAGGGGLPSITDAYTASECQRWRDIGERAVVYFNLSHVDPVAFVSLSGLADAVGRNPEAARQVARVLPRLLAFLVAHDPLAQPLSLLALRLWQRLPSVNTTHIEEAISAQLKAMGSNHTARFELPDLVLRHYHHHHHNYSPPPPPHPLYSSTRTPHRSRPADATANTTALDTSAGEPQRGRKLLQAESWKESLAAVRQYSIQIVSGDAAANTVPYDIAAQWSKGPFVWPPDYSTNTAASSECLLASILFNYTLFTAKSTLAYYTGGEYPHPPVERTFKGCLPRLPDGLLASTRNLSSSTSANPGFVSTQLIPGLNGLASTALGLDTDYLLAYMSMQQPGNRPSQLSQDITIVFTCDFNSVQHCTHFRRDLGWGALIVTLGLGIVSYMAKTVGVPYADPLLFLTFIPLVSVFVFGVSPFCAPMVSTCFVDELHNLATYLLPSSLSWPDMLQYYPDCINGAPAPSVADAWRARTAACFRPCTDWPFSFHDPRDSVAWLTLRLGLPELPTTTDALAGHLRAWGIPPELIAPMFAVLPESLLFMGDRYDAKRPYLTWADMRDAQDTCFGLTIFQLVLLVVGIVGLGLVLIAALVLPLLIAQFAVTLLVSVFVFVHV